MLPRSVLCLLLVLAAVSSSPAGAQSWPLDRADGRARDLYNLGLLGAKASDAIRGEPQAGTGRRSARPGVRGDDEGPRELRIELLCPEGPAERAGLQVGDVVVGVGRKVFKDGANAPLAEALTRAFSAKKPGVLELRVRRSGSEKVDVLEVATEPLGKWFARPSAAEARVQLAARALEFLAASQAKDGGFPQTLSGKNGAVVQTSMSGLAWIAGGSSLEAGPYAENLARAADFVVGSLGALRGRSSTDGANWNQENWGWAHAGMFLGELHRRSPSPELRASLQRIATALQENQESSGGLAHGPGGPNALDYVELNIVGGLSLCALGLARQAGCELDEARLERLLDYLEASTGDGLGYSTREGQVGHGNIGRTASAWLGLRALGLGKGKLAKRFGGYVKRNVDQVLEGHASLMQHILFAGIAAQAHGAGPRKSFWKALERDLVLALAPDGSLQPRPWHESLSMASNSDASLGCVWTTASWACVLLADAEAPGGLPGLSGTAAH